MVLVAALALAPGCTLFDEVLPGTPFTPDQPLAEVTVVGEINIDTATESSENCPAGRAVLWGVARNTGDLDVDEVIIEIDALGADNRVLGTFSGNVFNNTVTTGNEEGAVPVAGTSLSVDQSGNFSVCTGLSAGSIARTVYRTDFTIIDEVL